MHHAISPGPAAEAAHYASIDRAERAELKQEQLAQRAEEIIDCFDLKDAQDALSLAFEVDRIDKLAEALATLVQASPACERPIVSQVIIAWQGVAHYYAGHQAAKELHI